MKIDIKCNHCKYDDLKKTDISGRFYCPHCNKEYNFNELEIEVVKDNKIKSELTGSENERLRRMMHRVVTNFKGEEYLVLDVAEHTETGEDLVVYQALYGKNHVYTSPIKMFLSKVDEKHLNINQKYRFELKED